MPKLTPAQARRRRLSSLPPRRKLTDEEEMEENMAADNMGSMVEMHAFD